MFLSFDNKIYIYLTIKCPRNNISKTLLFLIYLKYKINNKKVANEIDNINGIVEQIKNLLEKQETILYIAASTDDFKKNEEYSNLISEGFN